MQLDDVGGVLLPDAGSPVRLTLPADVGFLGVNPNNARRGSFSPSRDRLALVANSQAASVLMTARVDRDGSTSKITGLSDLVVVGDLYSLGLPDPTVPASKGFTGDIDYSPDGSSIVASIYYDLWLVHLSSENTNAGADLLTANTDGFAEWKPAYSPEGTRIAYTAGPIAASTGGVSTRNGHLFADLGHACRYAGYHEQEQGQSGFGAPQRDVASPTVRRSAFRHLRLLLRGPRLAPPWLTASSS